MLVYGDARGRVPVGELVERLLGGRALLEQCSAAERRRVLVRLLLDTGELTQGLLDLDFKRRGADAQSAVRAMLARVGEEVAAAYVASLAPGDPGPVRIGALDEIARARLPVSVHVVAPEGYAYYALYPELYARAATPLRTRKEPLRVIGIRSIGASLAPVVAAAAGGEARTTLVRATGHPFARALSIADDLAREIVGEPDALYAVVDDGPGLSGSTFGAVGDWLERRGVRRDRVWYFPGHPGPLGPRASDRHRARWATARRAFVPLDESFVRAATGELEASLEDVGAGKWRARVFASEAEWPAVNAALERRKYLVGAEPPLRLLKYAGLGRYGETKLARAERLSRLGMIPKVLGLLHGFMAWEWALGACLPQARVAREAVVDAVAAYLAELAAAFPAPPSRQGAPPNRLLAMAKHNAAEALGVTYGRELERRWSDRVGLIGRRARPVCTDNKMHAWEWIVTPSGRLLKCDALDHHVGHDLVGVQDIAWDVAGARIELDLSDDEVARIAERIGRRAGVRAAPAHLPFYEDAYLAFQLGAYTLAREQCSDPSEVPRLQEAARKYEDRLRRRIEA